MQAAHARQPEGYTPLMVCPQATVWTLAGGLRVAFERRSGPGFAFDLRVPVGSAHDPQGQEGSSAVLEEWLFKGAAGRDARALQDAFDDLGVRRGGGVGPEATRLSVGGLLEDLPGALELVADVLLRPELPEAELPVLLDLARQDLDALQDSPSDLLAAQARRLTFPRAPTDAAAGFAHPTSGTVGGLQAISAEGLRLHLQNYGRAGSVLGLVADLPEEEVLPLVERVFVGWRKGQHLQLEPHFQANVRANLPDRDAEQTHLSLTAPGIAPRDPRWLTWQLALTALSGGSSSRLFTAVREERGLAYAVSASPIVLGTQGFLSVYAGSTPQRAPETLEVVMAEIKRLSAGLSAAEFKRAHAGLSASVVFGGESLRGRAHALTRDLALFGQVRSVASLRADLDALTLNDVNAFLADYHPMSAVSIVSLGPPEYALPTAQEASA